jgi:hypothetical protein
MAEYSDNIEQLYRALEKKGYNDIGTQDEFRQYVTDSANVSELHKALSKAGYDDIGTEQEFSDWLGSVKKSEVKPAETPADSVPDTMPDTTGSVVNAPAVAPETIAGSQEWRTNTVNQPGQNPYNGRTYGDIYDEVIRNYGQNIAKQGIDPYAEARAQIIQAGITDDLKPEDADKLALNIRHGYANRYADNVSKEMISTLPDQVPNIDDLVDGLWYTRDMQARVNHEAARLGLRKENYVNYYLKPHIAKALSDRYGYDTESAKHIAGRLLSQEEHTTDAIRRNEAAGVISEFASPMINEQFKKIQEVADKVSQQEREGSGMTPYGNYGQMMGGAIRNWQATDPEKVWQQLKPVFDDMGSWMGIVGNEQLFDQISQMAEAEGIPVNAYIDQYVIPAYANTVQKEFERIAVEREMPKNTFDYIVQKMGESLVGSIGKWMLASEARRRAQSEALQRTDMGQGEYKPGYGARIAGGAAAMLPDMVLPYGGPFGAVARFANRPVAGMAQYLITNGWKPLFARMAQSSAGGMTSLGAFEGVKGAIQGAINPEGYESILAEDKRNAFEILSDIVKGGFEHAVPSAVMGATMVGGPLGQKISNGRGLLANMLGWGTQVGVDAAGATALSAIQNMPKIVKGDITVGDLGNEFLESVGTFAALGLHGKAKEFASLAEGGRSINGVSFSKSEVQTIEDIFGKPMRDVIDDIDKLQKSRSLITKSRLGITAETEKQERNDAIKDAATYLFGNIMKSYQVPADMKVRMCQAFNVPLPEYALKPKVLETFDEAIAKSVDAGWIDMMNYEFNRPGGVADKLNNEGPNSLRDYELTLRLLFQDNKRYNEIGAKLQAGEELTPDEIGLVNSYNKRLEAIQAEYFKMEKERITAEFENAKGLKRGTIQKMIDDLKQGKGVSDPAMLNEFEEAMRVLSETLDEYKQKKEAAPTEENEATVAEAPKVNKAPVAEAPVTAETPVTDEVPTGDIPPVVIPEETVTVDPKLLVNDETGNIVEVMLTDGRKAYVKSGDPAKDARLKLVDEQGNPITLDDGNGYTIDQIPVDMIARDESGNVMISQTEKPKVDTTTEEAPAVPQVKVDKDGEPIYEESDVEATINDLRTSMGSDEEVAELVDDQISDLTDELAELTKTPKGKAKKHTSMNEKKKKKEAIKAAQKRLDYWNSVKEALNKPADVEQSTAEVEQSIAEVEQPVTEIEQKEPVVHQEAPVVEQPSTAPEQPTGQQKVHEAVVSNNIGKKFEYTDNAGMRTEITIDGMDDSGKVVITRQDFDKQGNPVTKPTKQTFEASRIGKGIIEGAWKPAKTIGDRLREAFKDKKKLQALTEVLNEDEMQKVMEAYEKGDQEALNDIVYELEEKHREDLILKGRDERNASVERILNGAGSREEKLRRIRLQYQGNRDAEEALSDESMQPTSFEEIIADMHSRVPKKGEGPIAYYSYTTPDGHEVVGMQSETGHGKKSGGDTKGYAPWLAPLGKGMSLTQYAENLRSQMTDAMQEQHDVQDVRNYVRDMFTSAEKPSDIPLMILRRAVQNAEIAVRHEEDMAIDNPSYQKVSHDEKSFAGRLAKAKQTTNTQPTEAQKEKGNYKKGHVSFGGYDFVIENPEGSMRRGEADGKKWEQKMNNTYGYILGKYGKDGDHLDMFINDGQDLDNWNGKVYVVDQIDPKTGLFDEHKVMYGFNSEAEARDAYLSNYEKGWKGLGAITGVSKEAFDKWLDSSKRKLIRFADHSIVRDALDKQANEPATDAEIETATRDLLIDGIKKAGADISTNYEEGQAGIDDFYGTGEIKPMGTSTKKRQKLIAEVFNDSKLSEDERKLVDVFSGKNDKTTLTITDKAGKNRKIQFRQGNERKAGIRHSVFRHLLTDANSYTADEVTLIPDIIANGERTQDKGNKVSYKYKKDGVVYTVTTEVKGKNELFTNFYTDRKPTATEQGTLNTENQHVQPQQTVSDAKIQQNSEIAKKNEEKISLQKGGFQLTIEQQERMDQARKMQPNPMKRYAVINMDSPYSVPKYFEKKEYANSYKVWGNRMGGNFKAFDLDANEKEGRPMFFKTPDGYAYGFTYRGKIYIDPSIATSETPIHEYGHLWAEMKRQSAPEEWNHIKQTLLADKLVEPFIEKVKRDYPELTGEGKEDDFVEEVLTQFSGKHGAEKLRKIAQEIKKELGDDATAETIAEAAIRRVKSVLNEFWKSVANMMGWKYTNAEDIADAVLRDLLNGVNPVEKMKETPKEVKTQGEVERTLNVSEEEAKDIRSRMEADAEDERILDRTEENWISEFGKEGTVETPIGKIKMGESQYPKSGRNDRKGRFGLIKPTLERPDVILEKYDPEEGAERDTKYLFIKSFKKADGTKIINFESVTVQKEGNEVSISSHQIEPGKVLKELKENKMLWNRFSDGSNSLGENQGLAITQSEINPIRSDSGLNPHSVGKDKKNTDSLQEKNEKSADEKPRFSKVSSPEPELTPEERQYWNKWNEAMKKWKEQNALPADAEAPGPETPKRPDETMMDYVLRITKERKQRALWQTAPKLEDYRRMRTDKDTLESAREEEQKYPDSPAAKMRRIAAEFQQIRSAMSRQKAYDKSTVKAVTDFAQNYMRMGFGDNLGRGDVERMLSSVKNAVGATTVKKEIDNIMNILTDNYLRNLEQQIVKLSSIRELRKNVQGVEVQGKLELKGQRMIQAFRTAMEYRMSADEIREKLGEVAEKMGRNDEEAPMWEQDFEGLSIALQYAENVEASRKEWAELDRQYKEAVKDYKDSHRSYQAQQELLASIENAMMENKIERIGMYGDIIGRLQGNISESMKGAHEFIEREKERIKHIQQIANFDLAGKDMGAIRQPGKLSRIANSTAARFFLGPLLPLHRIIDNVLNVRC